MTTIDQENGMEQRYFVGLLAFGATVALVAVGLTTTIIALLVCGSCVYGPRMVASRSRMQGSVPRKRPAPRPRPAREDAHVLVPDDPSLILSTYP
jgi:hypothetical protein